MLIRVALKLHQKDQRRGTLLTVGVRCPVLLQKESRLKDYAKTVVLWRWHCRHCLNSAQLQLPLTGKMQMKCDRFEKRGIKMRRKKEEEKAKSNLQ